MISRTARKTFHIALLSTAAVAIAPPAWAQLDEDSEQPPIQAVADERDADATAQEDGEIIVTGSRIARRDLTSTSPLAVVQDEEFRLSGAVNVEQVINTLPQVIPGTTSFSNNPGGGFATLNLRGLGSQRTLVLVNGRRWMFYSPAQVVDLNTIPSFLIDSVDVVTGGASAVYGSDALAGVVNFRLRSDLDGMIAGAQYSLTEEGDGRRYNFYTAFGTQFPDGRGHVAAYAEYYNRGRIMQADRDTSFFTLNEGTGANAGKLVPGGSANVPQGRMVIPGTVTLAAIGGQPAVTRNIAAGTNYAGDGAFFATPGTSVPYLANVHAHNFAPENYLMVPQERWLLGGYAEYDVTDNVSIYSEVSFINNRVANELAATPITQTVDVSLAAVCQNVSAADCAALTTISDRQIAANAEAAARGNPLPFGAFSFNAGTVQIPALQPGFVRMSVNQRVTQVGSRNTNFDQSSFRTLAGVRGNLTDTLTYDVHYLYARNRNANIQEGNISRRAFYNNVANGTCNVFGGGQLSPTCINNISITAQNSTISQLQVAQASISGPLFQHGWAADPIAFAAGVEWRSMRGQFIPDTALSSGDVVGFNAGQSTLGRYDVREAFAEVRIPLLQDQFIHRFELSGAGRYSDYSLDAVGGVWTYAAGAELAPIRDITFRGQYQRAVRAPNVGELFGGQTIGFPQATDPCAAAAAATNPTLRALCIATGVPQGAVGTGSALQPNTQIQGVFGGNPNLQEEVSDTWTVGAVVQPRFVPRLNITIDYYDIEIRNAIAAAAGGVANILNLCYNTIQDANHPLCKAIARDPLTGVISGGQFVVNAANANLGALLTSGVDLQVDYSLPLGFSAWNAGESRLSFFFLGTWTRESDFIPVVGVDVTNECAGNFGSTCGEPTPEYKWTSRLSWIDGPVTTSLRWRHISAVDDDSPAVRVVERIPSFDYFDLALAFDVSDSLTLNMGVNNLFDKKPPVMGANAQQGNTWPGTYDVLGRDYFISANFRF